MFFRLTVDRPYNTLCSSLRINKLGGCLGSPRPRFLHDPPSTPTRRSLTYRRVGYDPDYVHAIAHTTVPSQVSIPPTDNIQSQVLPYGG